MVAEKCLARHFLGTQQSLDSGDLDNDYWLSGLENPADGSTRVKSNMATWLRPLVSGAFHPGVLGHLEGAPPRDGAGT